MSTNISCRHDKLYAQIIVFFETEAIVLHFQFQESSTTLQKKHDLFFQSVYLLSESQFFVINQQCRLLFILLLFFFSFHLRLTPQSFQLILEILTEFYRPHSFKLLAVFTTATDLLDNFLVKYLLKHSFCLILFTNFGLPLYILSRLKVVSEVFQHI